MVNLIKGGGGDMTTWRFSIEGEKVRYGSKTRPRLTKNGCNEPYKGRYWCPKIQWFRNEACPFINLQECENFESMCGCL